MDPESNLLMSAGGRLGRDTLVYGVAIGVALPFGLASVVVFTRFLTPSEYGHLAVLLVCSALLTVLYNLPTLMGTISVAYGASGDEDIDDDRPAALSADRTGEALMTGLVFTVLTAALPTAPLIVVAPAIADMLSGDELTTAVRWAAASAAAGAVFRLLLHVPRMEHRPGLYASLSTLRPVFALTIGAVLVASGQGPEGVLAGLALGTSLAVVCCLLATTRSYAPRVSLGLVPDIAKESRRTAPLVGSIWTLQNMDLLLLSRYASDAVVGNYRVANRLAALVLYGVCAFLMAIGPVQRTSLFMAAHDAAGRIRVSGLLVRYFTIGGIYTVLLVALSADAMFLLAAPGYRDAAPLIPLIAAGFVTFGLTRVLARTAPVQDAFGKTVRSMVAAAAGFVPLCLLFVVLAGDIGAAAAMPITMLGACAWWAALITRAEQRLDPGWPRILTATAVATGCYGLATATEPLPDGWRVVAEGVVALLVCPALFVATGAVPLRHLRPLRFVVVSAVMPGRRDEQALRRNVERLNGSDLLELRKAIVISRSATARRMTGPTELEGFVEVLRQVGGLGTPGPQDGRLGTHLIAGGTYSERQARADALRKSGVKPADLYRLETVFERVRRLVPTS